MGRYYAILEPKFKTGFYFLPILTGVLTVFRSIPSVVTETERVICDAPQSSGSTEGLFRATAWNVTIVPESRPPAERVNPWPAVRAAKTFRGVPEIKSACEPTPSVKTPSAEETEMFARFEAMHIRRSSLPPSANESIRIDVARGSTFNVFGIWKKRESDSMTFALAVGDSLSRYVISATGSAETDGDGLAEGESDGDGEASTEGSGEALSTTGLGVN